MASVQTRNLWKRFGATEVLKGIDIEVEDGEFLVLVGPSGCGKSTLLNLIAGLETVSEGEVLIDGQVVNDVQPKDRDIAMVFQSYALYPTMSVYRNITFGMETRGVPKTERDEAVTRVAEMLQIGELLKRKPSQLSGGQRQRVAMGRALVRDPAIFLFDEPLSNLDAKLRVEMRHEIKRLHQTLGRTVVYVTHDQVEAMTLATRIAVMHKGIIQQYGAAEDIYNRPANLFVAGFMGSQPMNFIKGQLCADDGGLAVSVDDAGAPNPIVFPLAEAEPSWREQVGKPVILGLRPERIAPARDGEGEGEGEGTGDDAHRHFFLDRQIDMVEPTGADTMVFFTLGGETVSARARPQDGVKPGVATRFRFGMRGACLFDPESGQRL